MAEIKIFGKDGLVDLGNVKNLDQVVKGVADLSKEFGDLEKVLKELQKANKAANEALKDQAKDLKKTITGQKEYNETLAEAEKQAKELNKQYKDNTKISKQLDKAQEDLKKTQEELNNTSKAAKKVLTEREKLEAKLQATLSGSNDELIKLRVQQQQANKAAKERVQESLGLVDAYTKESKRLNELRKEAKNAALQFGKTSKEFKDLEKQVVDLDKELKDLDKSLGQNQREVGNYGLAVEDLEGRMAGLEGEIGQTINTLKDLGKAAKSNPIILIAASLAGLAASYKTTSEGSEDFAQVTAAVGAVVQETVGRIGKAIVALSNLEFNSLKDVFLNDAPLIKKGLDDVTGSFDNFDESVSKAIQAAKEAAAEQIKLDKANRNTAISLAKQSKEYELLVQKSGDATLTLQDQQKAAEEAAVKNKQIADQRVNQINEQIAILDKQASAVEDNDNQRIALENQIKELQVEQIELTKEAALAEADLATVRRQAIQDLAELELDVLIDGFDNLKTTNERIIADERTTFEEKKRLFNLTRSEAEKSYQAQVDVINRFAKEKVDIDALLEETDQKKVAAELKRLGLSEILNTRSLEILRERRTVLQDLSDIEKDLNDELSDKVDLEEKIRAQEERLNQQQTENKEDALANEEAYQDKLLQLEIEALERRIEKLKEGSTARLELEQELNDKLLEQKQERINKELELEQKKLEKEQELAQASKELQAGVVGAANQLLQSKVKSQIAAVVIDSVLGAIERGEDPTSALGKATFIKSALLALVNSGFHSGGYTGDGEKMQPAGIVHKGEFVIDKQKTAELGLRNKSMKDFNYMVENDMLSRDKNISDNVELNMLNRQVQVVKQDIDYDQMGQSIAKHMPKEQLKHVGELLAHEISTGNKKEITIFKGRKLNTY